MASQKLCIEHNREYKVNIRSWWGVLDQISRCGIINAEAVEELSLKAKAIET